MTSPRSLQEMAIPTPSGALRDQAIGFFPSGRQADPAVLELVRRLEQFTAAKGLGDRLDAFLDLIHLSRKERGSYQLLELLEALPEVRKRFLASLASILAETDATNLFGVAGLPSDRGFMAEAGERIAQRLLPAPRDDHDLTRLVLRLYATSTDLELLRRLPEGVFDREVTLLTPVEHPELWVSIRSGFADGFRLLATRVQAQGLAANLRARGRGSPVGASPFYRIAKVSEALIQSWMNGEPIAGAAWREEAAECRAEMAAIREHLEARGVNVDIVFGLEVLERCLTRMDLMLEIMESPSGPRRSEAIHRFLLRLATLVHQDRSLRHLASTNLGLHHRKIVDRSSKTGEHYIAGDRREYRQILVAAAGGGLLTSVTAAVKMTISGVSLAPFPEGLAYGINYAVSFLLLQVFGLVLATKQPAMTAATLATILRDQRGERRLDDMVEFTIRISRSQVGAALGNVLVVSIGAYAIDGLWRWLFDHPYLAEAGAHHVFETLSPVNSGTVFYAVLTGVILWLASLFGGWLDNWSVYHRLPLAIAEHPLGKRLGRDRMERLAEKVNHNISGWGTNVSLGFMLGITPALGHFLGVPLDVRHVTLSTGLLALACASLGYRLLLGGWFFWALGGIAVMFVFNLGVSFCLSLFSAVRAYNLPREETRELLRRLGRRFYQSPLDFVLPPPASRAETPGSTPA